MPTEKGIIESTNNKTATIRVQKNSACAHCESRGMCQVENEREMLVEVENRFEAQPGDQVEIMVPTGFFMKLSLMVYLFPVLAFMFGAFLGDRLASQLGLNPSLAAIIGGAGLMVIFFYLLKKVDKAMGGKQKYMPRMTRILSRAPKSAESGETLFEPS
jgi:sigma-E factor negative regulatory protein RseC